MATPEKVIVELHPNPKKFDEKVLEAERDLIDPESGSTKGLPPSADPDHDAKGPHHG